MTKVAKAAKAAAADKPAKTAVATEKRTQAAHILKRCVVLVLQRHWLGNHRAVDTADVVAAADGVAGKVDGKQVRSKKMLVDSDVLQPAMRILRDVQHYLQKKALPAHNVFGDKSYLLPLAIADDADAWLKQRLTDLRVQAALVAQEYDKAKAEQKKVLGPLFSDDDYPTKAEVLSAFSFDWHYVQFEAPDQLETVSRAAYESAKSKSLDLWASAYSNSKLLLRELLQGTVRELVKKLEPGTSGKKKAIRDTALDDLTEFLQTCPLRDVTDDDELKSLCKQLGGMTKGLDASQLRDDDALRDRLLAQVQAATAKADGLVVAQRRALGGLDAAIGA